MDHGVVCEFLFISMQEVTTRMRTTNQNLNQKIIRDHLFEVSEKPLIEVLHVTI